MYSLPFGGLLLYFLIYKILPPKKGVLKIMPSTLPCYCWELLGKTGIRGLWTPTSPSAVLLFMYLGLALGELSFLLVCPSVLYPLLFFFLVAGRRPLLEEWDSYAIPILVFCAYLLSFLPHGCYFLYQLP